MVAKGDIENANSAEKNKNKKTKEILGFIFQIKQRNGKVLFVPGSIFTI